MKNMLNYLRGLDYSKMNIGLKAIKMLTVFRIWFSLLLILTYSNVISQINCYLPTDMFRSYSNKELVSSSCNNENSNTNLDYINKSLVTDKIYK
jgi:hypothetical protein